MVTLSTRNQFQVAKMIEGEGKFDTCVLEAGANFEIFSNLVKEILLLARPVKNP